jgi:hypothetical protein
MQYRVETQTVSEDERRAINWAMTGHRTPASREKCAQFAQDAIDKALAAAKGPYEDYMAVLERARAAEAAGK